MSGSEASTLYCGVIEAVVDHLQADDLFTPEIEARLCLALHRSLEEAFDQSPLRADVADLLARLEARVRTCSAMADAEARRKALSLPAWEAVGDE